MRLLKNASSLVVLALLASAVSANALTPQNHSGSLHPSTSLRSLQGQGIIITLSDRLALLPQNLAQPVAGLVRASDVALIVNELRAAGAHGITVGGVRLTRQSVISSAGADLLVDKKRVPIPVRIEAVGNSARLKARLIARGGIVDSFKANGPQTLVVAANNLQLKAAEPVAPTRSQILTSRQSA